jgi:hypothetical protein
VLLQCRFARARSTCSRRVSMAAVRRLGRRRLADRGVDEFATGRVGEGNPVGVDLARGDPRRRGSAFPVVDGPLGVDQPPAVVFASHTVSQHPAPSRAATRSTGTRVTVPGICSSDRNKPTSLAMRDNLWISRADGSCRHMSIRTCVLLGGPLTRHRLGNCALLGASNPGRHRRPHLIIGGRANAPGTRFHLP